MPTYEEALKWYKQGIIDSNEGQEMFEDGVEADFHMIYGSQFPEQKEQLTYSGGESARVLKQKLNDLIELVTDDKFVLHATPVTGRPHDPNPEISRLRDEIVAEFSAAAPSSKEREMAFAQWIGAEHYHYDDGCWYYGLGYAKRVGGTQELYDLYLESLNKKP